MVPLLWTSVPPKYIHRHMLHATNNHHHHLHRQHSLIHLLHAPSLGSWTFRGIKASHQFIRREEVEEDKKTIVVIDQQSRGPGQNNYSQSHLEFLFYVYRCVSLQWFTSLLLLLITQILIFIQSPWWFSRCTSATSSPPSYAISQLISISPLVAGWLVSSE